MFLNSEYVISSCSILWRENPYPYVAGKDKVEAECTRRCGPSKETKLPRSTFQKEPRVLSKFMPTKGQYTKSITVERVLWSHFRRMRSPNDN